MSKVNELLAQNYITNESIGNDPFSWGEYYKVSLINGKKDGSYKATDENSIRKVEGIYSKDVRVGHWTVYWPDGFQPYEAGEFDGNGKKTGSWTKNNYDGRSESRGQYELDKKIGKWIFNDDTNNPKYYIDGEETTQRKWEKYNRHKQQNNFDENTSGIFGLKKAFSSMFKKLNLG